MKKPNTHGLIADSADRQGDYNVDNGQPTASAEPTGTFD
jgi:hypothetical protein